MSDSADPVVVVAEAIYWYARNPTADVSVSEVIVAALRTAGLVAEPSDGESRCRASDDGVCVYADMPDDHG